MVDYLWPPVDHVPLLYYPFSTQQKQYFLFTFNLFLAQAMVNVLSVIHMYVLALWCEYVMNATMGLIKVVVLYAVDLESQMLIIAKNVQFKRKT